MSAAPSAPAQTAAEYEGIREALKTYGMDMSGYDNDHAALQNLVMQARQLQELRQQVTPHWDSFRSWQAQEEARQREEQAKKNQWWKPPEWDPAWRGLVQRDPDGTLKAVPGAPAGIVEKYLNAQQHMQGFLEKFSMNPIEAIRPGIEQLIQEKAAQLVQQQMGGYQQQQSVQQFIQEHSGWLHERDQQGNLVMNPMSGIPQLSAWGQHFARYVDEGHRMGMNLDATQKYALNSVQRDYAVAQMRAANPQATNQDQKQQFLEKAEQRQAQPAGQAQRKQATPGQVANGRLEDRLKKAFKEEGFQLASQLDVRPPR
jgi:hypothetical protein